MKSLNFALIGPSQSGKTSLAEALKQKKQFEEMTVYTFKYGEADISIIDTVGDVMDVKTSVTACNVSDGAIITVPSDIDLKSAAGKQLGEKIAIVDLLGLKNNVVVVTKSDLASPAHLESLKNILNQLLSTTSLKGAPIIEVSTITNQNIPELRELLAGMAEPERKDKPFRMDVDHSYENSGRGIGCGVVRSGKIDSHGKVQLMPWGATFPVDYLLLGDKEVDEVKAGQRIGLAIKGVFPWDMPPGTVFCEENTVKASKTFKIKLKIHPFYKEEIKPNQELHIAVGMQWKKINVNSIDGEFKPGGEITLHAELLDSKYPIAFADGERIVVTRPDLSYMQLRICGLGEISAE